MDLVEASVVVVDRQGSISRCNQTFASMVGSTPAEVDGHFLWEYLGGERLAALREHLADGNPADSSDRWNLLLDDRRGDCRLISWTFRDTGAGAEEDREYVGTGIATAVDTSKPRSNQHDDLIRFLFEHSSEILCVLAPDGVIRHVSPSVHRLLGRRPEQLIGTNALDLVHPDDRDAAVAAIIEGIEKPGEPKVVELRGLHDDGEWVALEARGIAHRDGDEINVVVTLSDVSRRKEAERALEASEERFRSAFENTAIGKVLWSPEGKIVRTNRAFQNMLAFTEDELLGMAWRDQCHSEDATTLTHDLKKMLAGESTSAQALIRVRHRHGPWVWARVTLSTATDVSGAVVYIIGEFEDITEQRRAEEDKQTRLLRLARQQNSIVAIATHEGVVTGHLTAALAAITTSAAIAIEVQRASIWLFDDDNTTMSCADLYDADSDSHQSGEKLSAESYPRYFEALEADRVVDADDARSDPRTADLLPGYLEPLGINSLLDAPIRLRGRVVGVVCLEHTGVPRIWQSDEVNFAGAVADQVAQALANAHRNVAESRLHMSEERFRSIVNAIPMGLFMYRLTESGRLVFVGANPAADTLLGVECQRYIGKTIEEAFPPSPTPKSRPTTGGLRPRACRGTPNRSSTRTRSFAGHTRSTPSRRRREW